MIVSCIVSPFIDLSINYLRGASDTNPYIGLLNWLPLFISFVGFQPYLKTKSNRLRSGIYLIFGTIPILISGFGQYLFNWYGPLEFLNGLIIWYQRENTIGMTSIFNNQNYASCVLATVFPFFFASIFNCKNSLNRRIIAISLTILVGFGILFTTSRNGLLGLLIGITILLIPLRRKIFITGFLSLISVLIINYLSNLIFNIYFIPSTLINKLNFNSLTNEPRIILWKSAFKYIFEKPLLGWGGHSFSSIWNSSNIKYFSHSHSAPLEFAIQYGLLTSFILALIIIYILIKSFKLIFFKIDKKLILISEYNDFDRAWLSSGVVILFSNTIDILYYDLRISLLLWILLSGLRVIIRNENNN